MTDSKRVEIEFSFTDEDMTRVEEARWNGCDGAQLLPGDFPVDARLLGHYRTPNGYRILYLVPIEYARDRLGLDTEETPE